MRPVTLVAVVLLLGACATAGVSPARKGTVSAREPLPASGGLNPLSPPRRRFPPSDRREPSVAEPPLSPVRLPAVARVLVSLGPRRPPADRREPPVLEAVSPPLVRFVDAPRRLNMRAGPGTGESIVLVLLNRTEVRVLRRHVAVISVSGRRGSWVEVEAKGRRGWVFDAYLSTERPGEDPTDDFRELFVSTVFRSRLVSAEDDGGYLGGFTKAAGASAFRVQVLKRLCGTGEAERELQFEAASARFSVGYRWCTVDPEDIVNTKCVQCRLVRYRCELTLEELRAGRRGGVFERPLRCVRDASSYCERDCDRVSPIRDVEG